MLFYIGLGVRTLNKINFLKLVVRQHPLLETGTEFSLSTVQPVKESDSESVTNIYGRRYLNNISTIAGRNATGKTTLMTAVVGILFLFWGNRSIDQTPLDGSFFGQEDISFDVYFFGSDKRIYLDSITFSKNSENKWYISDEKIKEKRAYSIDTKDSLFDFSESKLYIDREKLPDEILGILSEDDSIFRMVLSRENYNPPVVYNSLMFTDNNILIRDGIEIPVEILEYLDPSIEYLHVGESENIEIFRLKFKNHSQEIVENKFSNLQHYLSSGTAKGVTLFQLVLSVLKSGGYLFVDEIENHFNQAIVRTFIDFFSNKRINTKNAILVFSTHYSELLQDLERGDQVFIVRKDKKTSVSRYAEQKIRSDLNRTDVFNSNYIEGSAPDYDAYINLKKAVIEVVKNAK